MKRTQLMMLAVSASFLGACASQAPQPTPTEAPQSRAEQQAAQRELLNQTPALGLKRKIAVGRLTNETNYGRSLLGTEANNALDDKISDMFMQSVANTNKFVVLERPDVDALKLESALSGTAQQLIGADTLVIGSLTEFGRATTGERGFFSTSQKQEATATVDLRLVNVNTGQVIAAVTGSGSSAAEQSRTMGFGSVAGYDGSLNDQAIGAAVNAAVAEMTQLMLQQPWQADILAIEGQQVFISGGTAQGVVPGMEFVVMQAGQQVQSQTTGATIRLPGREVARLEVVSTFGQQELEQGAITKVIAGSLAGLELATLEVVAPDSVNPDPQGDSQ